MATTALLCCILQAWFSIVPNVPRAWRKRRHGACPPPRPIHLLVLRQSRNSLLRMSETINQHLLNCLGHILKYKPSLKVCNIKLKVYVHGKWDILSDEFFRSKTHFYTDRNGLTFAFFVNQVWLRAVSSSSPIQKDHAAGSRGSYRWPC